MAKMSEYLIETRDLWQQRDGRSTLRGINVRVTRGEVFALIGPTGAGKTTLLRLISLLDTPARGRVLLDGQDANASDKVRLAARRRMAFVLQKPVVFNSSVYDNIAYGLRWRGLDRQKIREKVDAVLEMVGMAEYRNRNARTLSGGEMQRVAIGRAIAVDPEVLLLDEPTANLDPLSAARTEELITDIIRSNDITVIMSTHDMAQGQHLADRIAVLIDGEIRQAGASREIFAAPKSREVAEFVGMENIIDGVVAGNDADLTTIDAGGQTIEACTDFSAGDAVSVCIRPEDITVALEKLSSSARNVLPGKIKRAVSAGPLCRVEIDCGFPLVALVTRRSSEELGLEKGRQVYATFKAVSIHVIPRH
jgi:tungstate transport system ATP-binding protein